MPSWAKRANIGLTAYLAPIRKLGTVMTLKVSLSLLMSVYTRNVVSKIEIVGIFVGNHATKYHERDSPI